MKAFSNNRIAYLPGDVVRRYVVGFMFNSHNDVILIEKIKPVWQRGKLNGVGGKVEETDPNPLYAMAREFREETSVGTSPDDWRHVITVRGPEGRDANPENLGKLYQLDVFCCKKEFIPERVFQTTLEKPVICNAYDLPANVIFNLRWMIPLCLDPGVVFPLELLHNY